MFRKLVVAQIIAIVSTLAPFTPAYATNAQNFYFTRFEADYYLSKDEKGIAHLRVKEALTAVFPDTNQNHGLTRIIPRTSDAGRTVNAKNFKSLNFSAKRNGISEPVAKVEESRDTITIYLGDAASYVHGTQVYELEYEFANPILGYDGLPGQATYNPENIHHTEFYWNTNGNGWSQTFEELVAHIHYDDSIKSSEIAETSRLSNPSCYIGKYGSSSRDDCLITETDDGYDFTALRPLSAHENLTFNIMFNKDAFVIHQTANPVLIILTAILSTILVVALILAFRSRAKCSEKRDFYKTSPVPPEYTPIKELSLVEVHRLSIRNTSSPEVATLLGLAVAHKVKLIKGNKKLGGYKWSLECTDIKNISHSEAQVLKLINGGSLPESGSTIEVKRQTYSRTLERLGEAFKKDADKSLEVDELLEKGKKRSSLSIPGRFALACFFGFFLGLIVFAILDEVLVEATGVVLGDPVLILIIPILVFLIIFLPVAITASNHKYAPYTMDGLRMNIRIEGLRLYMKMAETDRLSFLQSVDGADTTPQGIVKLYEKLLPYAVLFSLESSWLAELQKYYAMPETEDPYWYYGSGPLILSDLRSFNSVARSSVSSATTDPDSGGSGSSGSSGGGGGGFSGGGGGGGGGGGW